MGGSDVVTSPLNAANVKVKRPKTGSWQSKTDTIPRHRGIVDCKRTEHDLLSDPMANAGCVHLQAYRCGLYL